MKIKNWLLLNLIKINKIIKEAKRKVDAAELDNRQLAEVLQSKDALIERLRNQLQNQKVFKKFFFLKKSFKSWRLNNFDYQQKY